MKKKIIISLVLVLGMIVLAACSTDSTASSGESSPFVDSAQGGQQSLPASGAASGTASQQGQPAGNGQANQTVSYGADGLSYPIVDTSQGVCYNNSVEISCPSEGSEFFGQDAQYAGLAASYINNRDGTVTDLNTGLMWQQDPGDKVTYSQAVAGADSLTLAGYDDWRLPTIKELYSLILFDGTDVSRCDSGSCDATPFIDTRYFNFEYGDESAGERTIDSQWATSTVYVSDVMNGSQCMFGVNFADGRIKCYGFGGGGMGDKTFFVIYVRGNTSYGENNFIDNGDGTISDQATGLMWAQTDSSTAMSWQESLGYCEDLTLAGYSDWRLPNAKELQSIVDYTRSPDTTNSAAIDPMFIATSIINEAGQTDYAFYWTSTTHGNLAGTGTNGVYVSFGRALGYMNNTWMDVHGAGAQRSDPKTGSAGYFGPQGDARRIDNYARCVRSGSASMNVQGAAYDPRPVIAISPTSNQMGAGSTGQAPSGGGQQPPSGGGRPSGGGQPPSGPPPGGNGGG